MAVGSSEDDHGVMTGTTPAPSVLKRAELLGRYHSGFTALSAALADVTDEDLDRPPTGGGWTARQIVHHLADAETRSYLRLREVLTGDPAIIQAYDEPLWAATLPSYRLPIAASVAVIEAVRASTAELLAVMSDDDWTRQTTHSEAGIFTVDIWLDWYANHPHDHAAQIRRAIEGVE